MANNSDWNDFDQELQELNAEFEEFGLDETNLSTEEAKSLAELDELVQSTGLGEDEFEAMSLDDFAESQEDVVFAQRWIRGRVRRLLKRLIALVRRYGPRLTTCVPLLKEAINLYRRRKYFAALRKCFQTFRCIKNALS